MLGTKGTHAGFVEDQRLRQDRVTDIEPGPDRSSACRKSIPALAAAGRVAIVSQHRVDHTRGGLAGDASRTERAAQVRESRSVAHRGIRALIGDLSRVDGAQGGDRRRLIGRHTGSQKIRNGDRGNDQDDCHYDQKLNQ